MGKTALMLILATAPLLFWVTPAHAQLGDIGYTFDISDKGVEEGDIVISASDGKITRAAEAFDAKLFGVIQKQPVLMFKVRGQAQGRPVARTGVVEVNVSTLNGPITPGDYITSSPLPGKGQKAQVSGYVIGIAMGPLEEGKGAKAQAADKQVTVGKVPVALSIQFADISTPKTPTRMLQYLSAALFKNVQEPDKFANLMKYLVAGMVAFGSFALGFFTFARSIPKGVEAVGRNPLAKGAIQFSMLLNIVFTIAITAVGIAASVLIIRL